MNFKPKIFNSTSSNRPHLTNRNLALDHIVYVNKPQRNIIFSSCKLHVALISSLQNEIYDQKF
jgi:hypothetical protein